MILTDFEGEVKLRSQKDLVHRLSSIRQGVYGAFILTHKKNGPSLWVHVNNEFAWLNYFPVPDYLVHAGYHAIGMTPPKCKRPVRFKVHRNRIEEFGGAYISIEPDNLVTFAEAVAAAREFFKQDSPPASIQWEEL